MDRDELMTDDFKKCIDFHGHICGGLVFGYKAAKAALEWLEENRAQDEELVAIVENDACGVDAVQVLTGCTFGKGNFIYKDYGKLAFTFFSRKTGQGVRISPKFRPNPSMSEEQKELFEKQRNNIATQEELARLEAISWIRCVVVTDPIASVAVLRLPPGVIYSDSSTKLDAESISLRSETPS